jgi:hypothetical protein
MRATYAFEADPTANMMKIVMSRFFQPNEITQFSFDMAAAFEKMPKPHGMHVTLVNIRTMDIKSQEAVAGFQRLLENSWFKWRRLASVVSKTLARLQITRAVVQRDSASKQMRR